MSQTSTKQPVKVLPWGEEVLVEIPLHGKSVNKFYARHGRTNDGREYLEFSKFGPKPNSEGETYVQKLRLFGPEQWVQTKDHVEGELASSIGWDIDAARRNMAAKTQDKKDKK